MALDDDEEAICEIVVAREHVLSLVKYLQNFLYAKVLLASGGRE